MRRATTGKTGPPGRWRSERSRPGIEAAAAGRGEVWVQEGTYSERITLRDYAHVYGGFAGGETQRSYRDAAAHVTVLDGGQAGSVVTATVLGCGLSTLDGFTVRNGTGTLKDPWLYGGGIYCRSAAPEPRQQHDQRQHGQFRRGESTASARVRPSRITRSATTRSGTPPARPEEAGSAASGPARRSRIISSPATRPTRPPARAARAARSTATMASRRSRATRSPAIPAWSFGAGIYANRCTLGQITGNAITGNILTAESGYARYGGGIHLNTTSLSITNNTISGNTAALGAGIYSSGTCTDRITGNAIRSNQAISTGGGIYCDYYTASTVTNNTIVANKAGKQRGRHRLHSGVGHPCQQRDYRQRGHHLTAAAFTATSARRRSRTRRSAATTRPTAAGSATTAARTPAISNTILAYNSSGVYATVSTPTFASNCVFANTGVQLLRHRRPDRGQRQHLRGPEVRRRGVRRRGTLLASSPCIDTGNNAAVLAGWTDIDGLARTVNGRGRHRRRRVRRHGLAGYAQHHRPRQPPPAMTPATARPGRRPSGRSRRASIRPRRSAGDVWVQEGTYAQRITLRNFAHLFGSFGGDETQRDQRDWSAHITILDGGRNGGAVVTATGLGAGCATIDGFTIRNGSGSSYGGGICCTSAILIANNTLTDNAASNGGAVYCSASATIRNNALRNNSGSSGGAIYCTTGSPTITGNAISNNRGTWGGAIYCTGSAATIMNNTIARNTADFSAGIYIVSCSPRIAGNVFMGNSAYAGGGGLYCYNCSSTITNNTFVANAGGDGGGAIDFGSNGTSTATVTNTIIAFNSSGIHASATDSPTLRNNCVFGNTELQLRGAPRSDGH